MFYYYCYYFFYLFLTYFWIIFFICYLFVNAFFSNFGWNLDHPHPCIVTIFRRLFLSVITFCSLFYKEWTMSNFGQKRSFNSKSRDGWRYTDINTLKIHVSSFVRCRNVSHKYPFNFFCIPPNCHPEKLRHLTTDTLTFATFVHLSFSQEDTIFSKNTLLY